jgi:hypothetical protein
VNVYDAATPAGHTPPEGHRPRVRYAPAGSGLDGVYASRYLLLGSEDVTDDVRVDVITDLDPDAPALTMSEAAAVDTAIADETPPDAQPRQE